MLFIATGIVALVLALALKPLRTYLRSILARRTPDRVLADDERSRLRIDEWLGRA